MRFLVLLVFCMLPWSTTFAQSDHTTENPTYSLVVKQTVAKTGSFQLIDPVLQRMDKFHSPEFVDSRYADLPPSALPFFSSLVVPGTGQMINRSWWRAGLYLAVEAVSVYAVFEYRSRGQQGEHRYERFADSNWSVVQYSNWLVDYHDIHGIDNPYIDQLREMINGVEPAFATDNDWNAVDINLLRDVEKHTPYITTDNLDASNFSHVLPEYGSQQYYELISKYYQYQAGWRDFDDFHNSLGHTNSAFTERFLIDRNGAYASDFFYQGVDMSYRFNQDFRISNRFLSLLIANHVISAFDAYFTVRVKQNRIRAGSSLSPGQQFTISYSF